MTEPTNRYSREQKGKKVEVVDKPRRYYESSSEEDEPYKDVYSTAALWDSEGRESLGDASEVESIPPLDKLTLAESSQATRENLVRVHGVTFRSVYDERTDTMIWNVNERHWKLPIDLITPELISSIPIDELPCKLSHKWNGHQILLYEGEIVHIVRPDAVTFLTQTIHGIFQEYHPYMPQVVACANRSNFRFPADLNSLIHQSKAYIALKKFPNLMSEEWVRCFMPRIQGNASGKPTPEPLILVPGIVCEARWNPETNQKYMRVEHTHWNLPVDLLTRNNKDSVHPLGITRKIKFRWNDCKIKVYEDGAVQLNRANVSHFYTRSIRGVFVTVLPNADEEL